MSFTNKLIQWYLQNFRDLPWRQTSDPYKIWLSEIILQQTRVVQGMNYYLKFVETFPSINDLANASEDDVLKLWQGLGYYSRARNLHFTAKYIVNELNGQFPDSYSEILKLKGVGEYTAAAIASVSFNLPHAVVDGNVFRFFSRYFGIYTPVDSAKGKKEFYELANSLIDKSKPGVFNQALIEFGAIQCVPQNPKCENCIFALDCVALKAGDIIILPVKEKKTKSKNRFFNYLYIQYKGELFISKRTGNDIWKNLFEFPLIETTENTELDQLINSTGWINIFGKSVLKINSSTFTIKHQLSHQLIFAKFYQITIEKIDKTAQITSSYKKIKQQNLQDYAVSRLTELFLEQIS